MNELSKPEYKTVHPLSRLIGTREFALVPPFRNRIRDRIVEATVKCSKLIHFDLRAGFECGIRYRLAQISIVVDDLLNCVSV